MALKTGFNHVLKIANNNDIIITMDTDFTYNPIELKIAKKIINEKKDVVIASRYIENSKIKGLEITRRFF